MQYVPCCFTSNHGSKNELAFDHARTLQQALGPIHVQFCSLSSTLHLLTFVLCDWQWLQSGDRVGTEWLQSGYKVVTEWLQNTSVSS